jgi:uncharacterized protein YacL
MAPRLTRVPSVAVELLRLLLVAFGAGVGYSLAERSGASPDVRVLGSFDGVWLGVVLGAAVGFVVGGIVSRFVLRRLDRAERALQGLAPEQVVAGGFGALVGVVLVAVVTWPVFLVGNAVVVLPLFLFLVVVGGLFGFGVAQRRRDAVLSAVGGRAGLAPRRGSAALMPRVLDTSVAIDGRVLDVVRAGFLAGRMLVPEPVLGELQALADSPDVLRRMKGRRGLDVLTALQRESGVELEAIPDDASGITEVDAKLVHICLDRSAALLTFDTNLAKVAGIAGVRVLNMHALALSLRPPVVVGDEITVHMLKAGKEAGQAVGYLDDGTMVVTEHAADWIGHDCAVMVTSVLTTGNGRMVFAKLTSGGSAPASSPAGQTASGRAHEAVPRRT